MRILIAFALWAGAAEPDRALREARALVRAARACAAPYSSGVSGPTSLYADVKVAPVRPELSQAVSDCRAAVSMDWLMSASGFKEERDLEEPLRAAKGYYLCRAAARADGGACAPLKSIPALPGQMTGNSRSSLEACGKFERRLRTAKALISGGKDAQALCRGMNLGELPFTKPEVRSLCKILLAAEKDPGAACAAAKKIYMKYVIARGTPDTEACEVEMRSFWGLEDPCAERMANPGRFASEHPFMMDHRTEEFCLFSHANAAYRKALAAGSAEACGADSPICRAMMDSDPAECEPYALYAKAQFCAKFVEGRLAPGVLEAGKARIASGAKDAPAEEPRVCAGARERARAALAALGDRPEAAALKAELEK